jgi:hypothetical protein
LRDHRSGALTLAAAHALAITAALALTGAVLAQVPSSPASAGAATARAEDIRDIRGPRPIEHPWRIALEAGALLALLGAGYALGRWRRRRKATGFAAHEVARERLTLARALLEPGRAREFSIELSTIVREFIEAHYGLEAAHRTTDEFLRDLLRTEDALKTQRAPLAEFLEACDLAKFGGWRLSLDAMEKLYSSALDFVEAAAAAAPAQDPPIRPGARPGAAYDSVPAP